MMMVMMMTVILLVIVSKCSTLGFRPYLNSRPNSKPSTECDPSRHPQTYMTLNPKTSS